MIRKLHYFTLISMVLASSLAVASTRTNVSSALTLSDLTAPVVNILAPQSTQTQTPTTQVVNDVTSTVLPTTPAPTPTPQAQTPATTQPQQASASTTRTTAAAQSPAQTALTGTGSVMSATTTAPATQVAYAGNERVMADSKSALYGDSNIRNGFAKLNPEQVSVGGLAALGSIVLGATMLALSRIQSGQSLLGLITGNA